MRVVVVLLLLLLLLPSAASTLLRLPPRRRAPLLVAHLQSVNVRVHHALDLHQVVDRLGVGRARLARVLEQLRVLEVRHRCATISCANR